MTARRQSRPALPNDPPLSGAEVAHIRALIEPRLQAIKDGTAKLFELDEVFDEIDAEFFGDSPSR
ncbi:MAG: hypothetical protein WDN06_20190 [Asticcacaulis sp.]